MSVLLELPGWPERQPERMPPGQQVLPQPEVHRVLPSQLKLPVRPVPQLAEPQSAVPLQQE